MPVFLRTPPEKMYLEVPPRKKFEPSGYPESTVDFDDKVRSL
jgi:hypothetical protein